MFQSLIGIRRVAFTRPNLKGQAQNMHESRSAGHPAVLITMICMLHVDTELLPGMSSVHSSSCRLAVAPAGAQ